MIVSIPQAVSTVATKAYRLSTYGAIRVVSIPQAVSTVATEVDETSGKANLSGFNTASGKYCCNY